MKIKNILLSVLASFSILPAVAETMLAQVTADPSLGTTVSGSGTYVITGGKTTQIEGRNVRNLFHSFDEFSLSTGESIVFDLELTPLVENIFSRVTGGRLSNINGTLAVDGAAANLFLLNPAGIVFGANAQLNLPGSFFATTADRLTFGKSAEFSISELKTPSLLTVSAPTGLQMGAVAGSITVEGNGHTLARLDRAGRPNVLAPNVQMGSAQGLQILPGKTLALIGNGVGLEGGILTAPSGNLELGSLAPNATVKIDPAGIVSYDGVSAFKDVSLQQRSLANVSGVAVQLDPRSPVHVFSTEQGRLQVTGRDISLSESSVLLGQSGFAATRPGGPIIVKASGQILVSGSEATSLSRSDITSETIGGVQGGDIQLLAQDLAVEDGAVILSFTFTDAKSGTIEAQVQDSLSVSGINAQSPLLFSTLSAVSVATGDSGDITLVADKIALENGGSASITMVGSGTGGDINVTADEILILGDREPRSPAPTTISSSTFGSGQAGSVTVNTRLLRVEDYSTISATSSSDGSAGDIIINATERIDIIDRTPAGDPNTAITSAVRENDLLAELLGLPRQVIKGDAGSVTINTPVLEMSGHSRVNVQNLGVGNAGKADIRADEVILRDNASIQARTFSGTGGNINLDIKKVLLMRRESFISAESRSVGDGGNLMISAPVIVALENSDITADAIRGNGGNVNIATQSLLGTTVRERRTPDSDITASSEFGVSGVVEIRDFALSPNEGLIELPEQVSDDSDRVAQGCTEGALNEFVASGRGGVPDDPRRSIAQAHPWNDLRSIDQSQRSTGLFDAAIRVPAEEAPALVESASWQINPLGQVELVAGHSENLARMAKTTCLQHNRERDKPQA